MRAYIIVPLYSVQATRGCFTSGPLDPETQTLKILEKPPQILKSKRYIKQKELLNAYSTTSHIDHIRIRTVRIPSISKSFLY